MGKRKLTKETYQSTFKDEFRGYHYKTEFSRFTASEKSTITRTIKKGIRDGETPTAIIRNLRNKGLGYTDKKMYHDIHRNQASAYGKSKSARVDAEKWYDRTFNKFRKEQGLTHRQTAKLWNQIRYMSIHEIRQMDDMDAIKLFWELYKTGLVSE